MTEEEKMLAGKLYDPSDPKLETRRLLAHRLSMEYNNTLETDAEKRKAILAQLLPDCGEDTFLQGPLQFDYGCYTRFGKRCYANFNLVVLDVCPVTFGDDVFIGPNCSFVSPMHALLPEERNLKQRPDGSYYDLEYGKAEIEIHKDAIKPGQKVVIIDDLIATGGTVEAAAKLIEQLGGEVVKIVFLMELAGLKGREKLAKYDVKSVIRYDGK